MGALTGPHADHPADERHYWLGGVVHWECGHTEIVRAGGCLLLRPWWSRRRRHA